MPTEAGHWYQRDGTPCYTVTGKDGKERATTLRDARKMGLVPSVTTIMKCAAAPGLTNWIIEQHILACLTMPRIEGEAEAAYIARIKEDAGAQAEKARARGTQIHAWIEMFFAGVYCEEALPFYESADKTIYEATKEEFWSAEKSFAFGRYGGKCDLHNDRYIIDFKTTEKDLAIVKTWDEHALQLSAYDHGIPTSTFPSGRKCGILYINVNTAESRLIWAKEKELEKGWKMFNALLDFWYAKTGLEAA
jgi:hypothetical protein